MSNENITKSEGHKEGDLLNRLVRLIRMRWIKWDLRRKGIDPDAALARVKKMIAAHLAADEPKWRCDRCGADVVNLRCECQTSPSPWRLLYACEQCGQIGAELHYPGGYLCVGGCKKPSASDHGLSPVQKEPQ